MEKADLQDAHKALELVQKYKAIGLLNKSEWNLEDMAKQIEQSAVFLISDSCLVSATIRLDPAVAESGKWHNVIRRDGWLKYVNMRFSLEENQLKASNTVFLDLLCIDDVENVGDVVLKLFQNLSAQIQFVIFPATPLCTETISQILNSTEIMRQYSVADSDPSTTLIVFPRSLVDTPLSVRRARVEDCDDLLPLFRKKNMLPVGANDYDCAEILESNRKDIASFVGEYKGKAVAFMSATCGIIDIESLFHHFYLPYDDILCSQTKNPETEMEPITSTDIAPSKSVCELAKSLKNVVSDPKHNAFCIRLFCIDEQYANYSSLFLKRIFNAFPDKKYCFLTLPTTCAEFPLLKNFLLIDSLKNRYPAHSLYMCSKISRKNVISIQKGLPSMIPKALSVSNSDYESMLQNCGFEFNFPFIKDQSTFRLTTDFFFLIEAFDKPIGFCILSCTDLKQYAREFDVERWIEIKLHDEQVLNKIEVLVLNPLFESYTDYVLGEIMRYAETDVLFYSHEKDNVTINLIKKNFVPILPRAVFNPQFNTPLFLFTSKMLFDPRTPVSDRIVFVGASTCNLTAIQNLVFSDYYIFKNIVLVTPEGLLTSHEHDLSRNLLRSNANGLDIHITVVSTMAASIEREKKLLHLDNGSHVRYDTLVLGFGLSFYSPVLETTKDVFSYEISNLQKIQELLSPESHVCVLGSSLESIEAVNFLLKYINGLQITHAFTKKVTNAIVWASVQESYTKHKIRIFEQCKKLKFDSNASIEFCNQESETCIAEFPCTMVILADEKSVSLRNFKLINDALLVYDNGVIIKSDFSTCDPDILAAGSACKFSKQYTQHMRLFKVSSSEIGQRLSQYLLPDYYPVFNETQYTPFVMPITNFTFFPDGKKYFSVTMPVFIKSRLPKEYIATGVKEPYTFMKLGFDLLGCIKEINYLGTRDIHPQIFGSLFGLSEKYFHNLVQHYHEEKVPDIYEYILQPRFAPILSDRFGFVMSEFQKRALHSTAHLFKDYMEFSSSKSIPSTDEVKILLEDFEKSSSKGRDPAEEYLKLFLRSLQVS